jgi:hypothetical protein
VCVRASIINCNLYIIQNWQQTKLSLDYLLFARGLKIWRSTSQQLERDRSAFERNYFFKMKRDLVLRYRNLQNLGRFG